MTEVKATVTFSCYEHDEASNHVERVVEEGEAFPADHPIVEGHRELFEAAPRKRSGSRKK